MIEIDQLWNFGDPRASEGRFRDAILSAPKAQQDEIRTQLARALGLQGRFDEGHAELDQIESSEGRIRTRVLLERGRLHNSAGESDRATGVFLEALKAAEAADEPGLEVDARHMLGISAPVDERISWNISAIERAEATTDPRARRWLGSLLNNLGWTYHDQGDFSEALDCFERALIWHEEHGSIETIRVARWSVGRAARSAGQLERALSIQQQLEAEIGMEMPDGYVYEEIAECLLALGNDLAAARWFRQAHLTLSTDPWLVANEPLRLNRLRELSIDQE